MKRNITSSVLFIASLSMFLLSAQSNDDDPDGEAGATGSPNEETCADTDCHETYMLNSGPGFVVISSPDLVNLGICTRRNVYSFSYRITNWY